MVFLIGIENVIYHTQNLFIRHFDKGEKEEIFFTC